MREFFRPRRRKMGVVMLVLSLAFMGLWVRSLAIADCIKLTAIHRPLQLASNSGQVIALTLNTPADLFWYGPDWACFDLETKGSGGWPKPIFFHFEFEDIERGVFANALVIPYRTIVVPLTLLSAYLLFSKPRQENHHKPLETEA